MDEMIKHFNDVVSAMSISIKDKMTILGLITAIGYKYQDDCKAYQDIIETDRDEIQWLKKCVNDLPAADVRPVVLCRDCINYVKSEEVNGEKMCVRDADWSVEDGCYYGFTEYPSPDWFCADGEKGEES